MMFSLIMEMVMIPPGPDLAHLLWMAVPRGEQPSHGAGGLCYTRSTRSSWCSTSILLHYEMVVISGMTNITSDLDPEIWSPDLVVEISRPQMETLDPVMVWMTSVVV